MGVKAPPRVAWLVDRRKDEWFAPEVVRERVRKYRLGEQVTLGWPYGTANLWKSPERKENRASGRWQEKFQGTDDQGIGPERR